MKQIKKAIAIVVAATVLLTCFVWGAGAVDTPTPYTSNYLSNCSATLSATGSGKLTIRGTAASASVMSTVGMSYIKIYQSNGTLVTTIYGSIGNGMTKNNASYYSGSYTYQAKSGTSYYAVVTFVARDTGGSQYKSYTTATVTA